MVCLSSGRRGGLRRRRSLAAALIGVGWLLVTLLSIVDGTSAAGLDRPVSVVPELPVVAADVGDVVVVSASDRTTPLTEGDTNTVFSLRLPPGSVCPGDSANDDWRVQSFIVPAATDLAALRYGSTRPRGEFMYGLYTTEGRPYVQVLLSQNPSPGQPGQILNPPPLSFGTFTPDLLPVGRYKIGIACSYYEVGAKFWDVEIVLSENRDVEPGQRTWALALSDETAITNTVEATEFTGSEVAKIVAAAAALAALAIAFTLWLRQRGTKILSKEHSR